MSLWQKYTAISPRTRIVLGLGVIAYSSVALYLSDRAESAFGLEASEEDRKKLIPKIRTVERSDVSREP